jgi:hypothetical protein
LIISGGNATADRSDPCLLIPEGHGMPCPYKNREYGNPTNFPPDKGEMKGVYGVSISISTFSNHPSHHSSAYGIVGLRSSAHIWTPPEKQGKKKKKRKDGKGKRACTQKCECIHIFDLAVALCVARRAPMDLRAARANQPIGLEGPG